MIINELSRMSRGGWEHATAADYEPLETRLRELQTNRKVKVIA